MPRAGTVNVLTGLEIAYEHSWGNMGLWAVAVFGGIFTTTGASGWLERRRRSEAARVKQDNRV